MRPLRQFLSGRHHQKHIILDDGSLDEWDSDGGPKDQLRSISVGRRHTTTDSNESELRDPPPLPVQITQTNGVVHAVRPSRKPLPAQIIQINGIMRAVRPAKNKDSVQQLDVPKMIKSNSNQLIPSEVQVSLHEPDALKKQQELSESPKNMQPIVPPPPLLNSTEVSPHRNGISLRATSDMKEDDPLLNVVVNILGNCSEDNKIDTLHNDRGHGSSSIEGPSLDDRDAILDESFSVYLSTEGDVLSNHDDSSTIIAQRILQMV